MTLMPNRNDSSDNVPIDLLVIGGGINGCGIARDAAGRGLNVTLCEKDDLAAHTSSASTKLIHGGLRYLESYDFLLVHHSLKEREVLLRSAPHIIWPLRFILPYHKGLRPRWLLRLGLFLYDHIGGRKILPPSFGVNLQHHVAGGFLKPEFQHAFEYSDCWVQDARLVILNARDAANNGAEILTRVACTKLERQTDRWQVTLQDTKTGTTRIVHCKTLVNASGPWVEKTASLSTDHSAKGIVRQVKGSHIIVNKLFQHPYPYIIQHVDGRILFAIPYEQEYTLLGTTDKDYQGDLNTVEIDQQEIDYICQAISVYAEIPVTPDQVISSYSGVRPLYDDGTGNVSKVSRDYELELDENGPSIINVYGGKITTYRQLAEKVLDLLAPSFKFIGERWTENSFLPGGDIRNADFTGFFADYESRYPWLDKAIVLDYCRNYGTEINSLLNNCKSLDDLGKYFGAGLYEREIDFLMEKEWAQTADDILWRRTKKGLKMTDVQVQQLTQWLDNKKQSKSVAT
jgi:glycerol-3-phosphate dehydrogenase